MDFLKSADQILMFLIGGTATSKFPACTNTTRETSSLSEMIMPEILLFVQTSSTMASDFSVVELSSASCLLGSCDQLGSGRGKDIAFRVARATQRVDSYIEAN